MKKSIRVLLNLVGTRLPGLRCSEKVPWPQSEFFLEKMSCSGRLLRSDQCAESKEK